MPADLGRFKNTLIYSRRAPIDALLEDLAAIREIDRGREKELKFWGRVALFGLVGCVATFFLPPTNSPTAVPITRGTVLALFAAMIVVGLIARTVRKKLNLENRRYELAERILMFLRRDTKPDAEVAIDVDFRQPNVKAKYVREGKVRDWKVRYYSDRWLRIGGRLLDGTTYRLSAIEKHQDRSKWARSRSGKSKHKSKVKTGSDLTVSLKVKTERYPELPALAKTASRAVKLPEWAALKKCSVHVSKDSARSLLVLRSASKSPWTCESGTATDESTSGVRWFVLSFLSLYQVLHVARGAKSA